MKGSAFISQPIFFFEPKKYQFTLKVFHSQQLKSGTEMMYFVLKGYGEVNNHTRAMQ
jgi:hypothetical protein